MIFKRTIRSSLSFLSGKGVASASIVLLLVKCLTAVVTIGQTMLLSRALNKSDYGTYSQCLLVITLFAPLLSLGLDSAVSYFYNREENDYSRRRYINSIFGLSLISGVLGALLLFIFRNPVASYYHNAAVAPLMMYICLRPCLQNQVSCYQNLYISSGHSVATAARSFLVATAQIIVIALAACFTDDLSILFCLLFVLDVVQLLILSNWFGRKEFLVRFWEVDFEKLRQILSFGIPLLMASSVGTLSANADRMLLSGVMSVEDFALFSNMAQELPFSFIISSFTAVVTPAVVRLLSNKQMGSFRQLWGDYIELGYTLTWPLCISAFTIAPSLIEILYSARYLTADGVAVFRVYTLVAAFRFTYFGLVPTALGEGRIVLAYSLISLVTSLPLTYVLYMFSGMVGASSASLVAMAISSVFYLRRSIRLTSSSLFEILRPKSIIALILPMLILSVVVATLLIFFNRGSLLNCIIGFVAIAGGSYLFRMKRLISLVRSMNANSIL